MPQRCAYIKDLGAASELVFVEAESPVALLKLVRRQLTSEQLTLCVEIDGRWVDWDKTKASK